MAGRYAWGPVGEVPFASRVERARAGDSAINARASPVPAAVLDFKWADNIQQTGDWSDFTLNGDAAPDDRFNYRAVVSGH